MPNGLLNDTIIHHKKKKVLPEAGRKGFPMTKTSEFLTLLRQYRGVIGNIRVNEDLFITFDSVWFNYYESDDEIQFALQNQEGHVAISHIVSYDRIPDDELFENAVSGYDCTTATGIQASFFCYNPRNH